MYLLPLAIPPVFATAPFLISLCNILIQLFSSFENKFVKLFVYISAGYVFIDSLVLCFSQVSCVDAFLCLLHKIYNPLAQH